MKKFVFILLFLLVIVAGCSKDKEETAEAAENKAKNEIEQPEDIEEAIVLPYVAPFTGIRSADEFKGRPVIVTINNHPAARPQSGIASADIVYEMVAEGNVTRLLALYQSELPDEMGPVRSARDYFIEISKGLDAFYVAHGYSPDAKQMLDNRVVDHINGMQYDGILFRRSSDRVAPHNSYISGEQLLEGMDKVSARKEIEKAPSLSFYDSAQDVPVGILASTIDIRYGSSEDFHHVYSYDTITQQYNRTSGGAVTMDLNSGQDVSLANVLFFETSHQTIDAKGRQQLDLTSGGRAYLFQAGVMKEITWQQIDGVLVPMENGQPAKLVPGKSWIHLVNTNPGLDQMVTFTP
jgi:hypothetical protein